MKQIINSNCIINYSESLEELSKETINILDKKIKEYKEIFNVELNEPITVNYFDDKEEFRKFIIDIRKEDTLPKYATATYDNGMVNAYIEKDNQLKRIYTASHELFHIMYLKYALKNDYSKRIVWYDEGMAQYMSGEKDEFVDENKFKIFYQKVKETTKKIPNLNELSHGTLFVNESYNAYDLSYLSIKYLSEIISKENFLNLLYDTDQINELGNNIVNKMFNYYDDYFE